MCCHDSHAHIHMLEHESVNTQAIYTSLSRLVSMLVTPEPCLIKKNSASIKRKHLPP